MLELIANNLLYDRLASKGMPGGGQVGLGWEWAWGWAPKGVFIIFDTRLADCRCSQRDLWYKLVEMWKNEVINSGKVRAKLLN